MDTVDRVDRLMAGRFRLGRTLGTGGMGTVHEATDTAMDRPVALKLLRRELSHDKHQLQRFEREARAAAKLAHPNIVGVTELVKDDELGLGLVMELLAGQSLASRLEKGPLSEIEAVNVFMQALDGLSAAHAAGMVHRDLKPSNVFLVPIAGGVLVKLLDFGIVKLAEEGASLKLTRKGALIGTPTYMSPEQVACDPVDARSDVYSMGACLYEALSAQPPYDAPHSLALVAAVGAGPPRDLHDIDRDVSPDLVHVVRVAMARDRDARYQTAAAMREALRGAVIQSGPRKPRAATTSIIRNASSLERTQISETPLPRLPSSRRGPVVFAIVTVALIGIALLALVALGRGSPTSTTGALPPATSLAPSTTLASPPPTTLVLVPPPATTSVIAPPESLIPRGVEPPPTTTARPHPPATTTRPRPRGRLGEDVMDPFAP